MKTTAIPNLSSRYMNTTTASDALIEIDWWAAYTKLRSRRFRYASTVSFQDISFALQSFCLPFSSLFFFLAIAAGFPLQLIVKSGLSHLWITLWLITHILPPPYMGVESQFISPRLQFLLFIVWKWVCIKMKRNRILICLELAWMW